uniref:Leucine aminopeptidase n=1 Tax=Echinococcus granulosus TaxID=6210 RepID=A0A336UEJ6_ECHGR|nr:leucine aminopeptidase [Echinococcus granulosus]
MFSKMRGGLGLLVPASLGRICLSKRHFSEEGSEYQRERKVAGLVGGYAVQRHNQGLLSPAIAYVDEVFLNGGIKDRISKCCLSKIGAMDLCNATFLQSQYCIVCNPLIIRSVQNKEGDLKDDPGQGPLSWRRIYHDKLQMCIGRGVQTLQRQGVSEIFIDPFTDAEMAAETAHLAAYSFDELKNPKSRVNQPPISCFTAHFDNDPDGFQTRRKLLAAWNRGRVLAQAQNQARRWMEMPANLFPPEVFAHEIEEALSEALKSAAGDASLTVEVHDKMWIEQQDVGGVLGVARGSTRPPCFVEINFVGDPSRLNDHIALVGKGVTFDSGGISIKPSAGMGDMRADMGGAAVITSVITGLIQLQTPINIRAYLPLVENMPDGNAIRPGDVIRMASGTTVQVDNTDAEGRLILADALHYAQSRNPLFLLDAATLTGAISVSLGDQYTGLFCNRIVQQRNISNIWPPGVVGVSDETSVASGTATETSAVKIPTIIGSLNHCGLVKNDPFWHMPSLYFKQLKESSIDADIANITGGAFSRLGGSGAASAFLQSFVSPRIPFVHLDIAGVMKTVGDDPGMRRGMTGRPTRPLIHFFDQLARYGSTKASDEDEDV